MRPNPALNCAPFGRWTLRDKAAQGPGSLYVRPMKTIAIAATLALASTLASAAEEGAGSVSIGTLTAEYCAAGNDQRYWYPRVPPFVGYSKGERTIAGGDGNCYLGFPKENSKSAVVMVDGQIVTVAPIRSEKRRIVEAYASKDGSISIEVMVTGYSSTCVPGADKCCGDYTYATIKVTKGDRTSSVKAARYAGG
jgi:hypothetical protein